MTEIGEGVFGVLWRLTREYSTREVRTRRLARGWSSLATAHACFAVTNTQSVVSSSTMV